MPHKPPDDSDKLPEAEAEERFNKLVGNLVRTPHKPHKPAPPKSTREEKH
jgi:hypothetical protein